MGPDADVRQDPSRPVGPPLAHGSPGPLLRSHDAVLVDLDGVVYLGTEPVPRAAETIEETRRAGVRVAFVTNNASRTPEAVAQLLSGMGIPATGDDVVTAAQAAATLVADRLPVGAPVLVTGAEGLRAEIHGRGFRLVAGADDGPAAVVSGYDPTIGYPELAEAALALRGGALWVAANIDATLPSPRGLLPGNGALIALLATATDRRPLVAGKPELPLHREAVRRTASRRPLVIGDRLDTDIAGAVHAAVDSLLVLTGVATWRDLLAAPPERRPTFLAADIAGLLRPHPGVELVEGYARCGAATATMTAADSIGVAFGPPGAEPTADPPGARSEVWLDGVRAACVLHWAVWDSGGPAVREVTGLDRRAGTPGPTP